MGDGYPKRIYDFQGGDYALCFQCHDRRILEERGALSTGFRDGDRNLHHVHLTGDKGRACDICHDPHASDGFRLVREEVPFGPLRWPLPIGFQPTEDGGRCTTACHEEFSYSRQRNPAPSKALR